MPAFAQDSLFDDPLEAIKSHLQEQEVSVIDYSRESRWGGLSGALIKVLKEAEYESLKDLQDFDFGDILRELTDNNEFTENLRKELRKQNPSISNAELDLKIESALNSAANSVLFAVQIQSWGNLPKELIEVLELSNLALTSLDHIAERAGYDQQIGNVESLIDFLKKDVIPPDRNNLTNDEINLIINELRFTGESQIQSAVLAVAKVMRNLLGGLAVIWIVVAGIQMVMARGDESKITEQKRAITYAMIGLVVILVLERLIVAVYGVPGVERGIVPEAGAGIDVEIYGIISFIKAVIGAVAILVIIISGFKTIAAEGEEEKITKERKSIMWIIIGIVLIVINKVIIENLYIRPVSVEDGEITRTNVENIINLFGTITQFLLGFVGLIAFAALIYGAGSMIANYGNDEMVQKAKKIIRNAIIGIIIIISAFAIVSTIII